jgi:hypothetical protein
MQRLKYLTLIVLAIMMTGCGQTVVETLKVSEAPGPNAPGAGMTIVILPFADYTYADNIIDSYRRNLKVTETLTDNLSAQGFSMPVQEDVFQYMVNQGVIQIAQYENSTNTSLTNELDSGGWGQEMQQTIQHYINEQQATNRNTVTESPGTHALTTRAASKLGREFQADFIVRGRILEFKTRQDPTWAPWRKGIIPVISGTTAQIFYGFAGSDQYDTYNQMAGGAMWGLIAGHNSNWPADSSSILSGTITNNQLIWGAVGAGLGYQASKSGKVDQAVVQLRIWIQDAVSGQVVWTNRASVSVSPETVLADASYDTLFNTAIDKGVSTLIDNFVTTGL